MTEFNFDKKDPSIQGNKYPLEGIEDILKAGFEKVEPAKLSKESDTLEMSQELPPPPEKVESDRPRISIPDPEKISDPKIRKAAELLQTQKWLAPSFIAAFTAVMFELLQLQKEVRYKEANIELLVRNQLYELSKSNAHLAKLITDSQAWEKLVQAVSSFVTAAVTTVNLVETTKNMGEATKYIDDQTKKHKEDMAKAMQIENPTIQITDLPKSPPPTAQQIKDHLAQFDNIVKNDQKFDYKSDEVKKHQKALMELEGNREYSISNRERTLSMISQMRGEALKSTIQGVTGVLTATITFDRGRMEEIKGLNEGEMQSMNKFSETSSKARDDAKANYDRFADYIARIIDSVFKAHKLTQSG